MKEVLSQNEIDLLLNAINTNQFDMSDHKIDDGNVKPYDFRRPFKLAREYVDTLHMIFENFAKLVEINISNHIYKKATTKLKFIEQVSFDEFINGVPPSTVMGLFKSRPLLGSQIILMSPPLSMQVIELMCGGSSYKGFDSKIKSSFTEIELSIVEEIFSSAMKSYESVWSEMLEVKTELYNVDSNLQTVQVISPNEPVVVIAFDVEIEGESNLMMICIPYSSFDNVMDKLSFQHRFKNQNLLDDHREELTEHVMSIPVDMEISLGRSVMSIEDMLKLEVGDVIQLNTRIKDPLGLYVENSKHYNVVPGQIDGKLAVKVVKYTNEEDGVF